MWNGSGTFLMKRVRMIIHVFSWLSKGKICLRSKFNWRKILILVLTGCCLASRIPGNLLLVIPIFFEHLWLFVFTTANQVSKTRRSSEACCKEKNLLSCQDAVVNPNILNTKDDIRLADVVVSFKSTVAPNGYIYQSPDGDEAVITFNEKTGNMFGTFKTTSGRSFAIEKCSSGH